MLLVALIELYDNGVPIRAQRSAAYEAENPDSVVRVFFVVLRFFCKAAEEAAAQRTQREAERRNIARPHTSISSAPLRLCGAKSEHLLHHNRLFAVGTHRHHYQPGTDKLTDPCNIRLRLFWQVGKVAHTTGGGLPAR